MCGDFFMIEYVDSFTECTYRDWTAAGRVVVFFFCILDEIGTVQRNGELSG